MAKREATLTFVLPLTAAFVVIGGLVMFLIAWKGVELLKRQGAHAKTVMIGDTTALAGRADYVGLWEGGGLTLDIGSNGTVDYSEHHRGSSEKMHGAVSFDGGDMVIDALVVTKRLHVDVPPHLDGTRWVMRVDGRDLERAF